MRNRALIVVLAASALVFLTAMGGKGGGFDRAPRVDKNYAVTVVDLSGNTIQGEKFSWEGRLHFAGSLGMASVTLPFDRIKSITVGEKKERRVKVTARLKEGGEASVEVDADSRCYGDAPFGSFMLTMEEIKSVEFK
ncbi:MAG: hypothetical protein M0042_15570 [Nitrospiraceae bacterium]|nr:hypothetical protein [Nitrospiraceae bacterium]